MIVYYIMVEYFGKEIFLKLHELVTPLHTALVVVDVQNDFVIKDGKLACPEMVSNLKSLIDSARRVGVPVIYLQDTLLPRRFSDSAPYFRKYMRMMASDDPKQVKDEAVYGTWGHEIIEEIKPYPEETRIIKYRSDGFIGTGLDLILRSNQIKTTIMTGVVTGGCVKATVTSAANEYFVVIAEDCVWDESKERHENALLEMRRRYDVVKAQDIITIWNDEVHVESLNTSQKPN
jgi:nicotinamidase-related amidase